MLEKDNIPRHVAIIMDGNGRWAEEKGLARTAGHREGIKRVKEIIKSCVELDVKVVTFFAFSTENWDRPQSEIDILMRYLDNFLSRELNRFIKNNIRFRLIGRGDPIPKYLQKKMHEAEEKSKYNDSLTVVLALNYGARQEIVDAAVAFASDCLKDKIKVGSLDENKFEKYLYTTGLPDPDLLIRTSGEMRISNFLLWQLSYAELYFPKKYWPDFKKADLEQAIEKYQKRERRFGRVNDRKKGN